MTAETKDDLTSFHEFVGQQLQNGRASLTPEEVVALWREHLETIESVHRGLQDIDAGRSRPADEVLDEIRQELMQS